MIDFNEKATLIKFVDEKDIFKKEIVKTVLE